MNKLNASTEQEAKAEILAMSKANPKRYIYTTACFGLFATVEKRLHVHAPCDSVFSWYALNGKVKQFTGSQKIADQNATPTLS